MKNPSHSPDSHRATFWGLMVFTGFSALLTIIFFVWANDHASQVIAKSRTAAINAVGKNARLVTKDISALKVAADDLASELTRGDLTYADIDTRLKTVMQSTDGISLTVALLPKADPIPGGLVDDRVIEFKFAINSLDSPGIQEGHYTRAQVENREHGDISVWYERALEANQGVWFSSPYMSPFSERWWACGYSVPFSVDGRVAGVVAVEFTVAQLNQKTFLAEKESFEELPANARLSSYSMLVSESGAVFSHPDVTVIEEQKQLSDLFLEQDDRGQDDPPSFRSELQRIPGTDSQEKEMGISSKEDITDPRSGQVLSVFFAPVEGTTWWTVVVLGQKAVGIGISKLRWIKTDALKVAISALAFVFGLVLLACRVDRGTQGRLWSAAIFTTLVCMGGIAWALSYSMHYGGTHNSGEVVLNNRAMPSKVIMEYRMEYGDAVNSEPITVPTGIFVQSAEFSSANNVTITGFVW